MGVETVARRRSGFPSCAIYRRRVHSFRGPAVVTVTAAALLTATALTAAAAPPPRSPGQVQVPETLAQSVPVRAGAVVPGFPVDYVAVTWDGEHGDALVRFRHGSSSGAWRLMGEDGLQRPGRFSSALVPADDADAYQVRVPGGVRGAESVAINTTDGPLATVRGCGHHIPGHRDFAATECPGGVAHTLLPTIRDRVAARQAGTLVEDTHAPVISSVRTALSSSTAVVRWSTTADRSNNRVQYWRKATPGVVTTTPLDLRFVEAHAVTLSGLRAGTVYQYRVVSTDAAGNRAVTAVGSFTSR